MSEELKRAQARQRLKKVMEREQAKLPTVEPGASDQVFEVVKTTKSEELLSKEELRRLLFTIIKDSEQVDNIMNDMDIVNDESAPLLVENFKKMVAELKSTYKSGVAFPQLKGFISRYSKKLLKQVTPEQNITYQTGATEGHLEAYRRAIEEVNNLRSLIANGELLTRGQVNEQARTLLNRLAESNQNVLANEREVQRLQQLIVDGVLVPSSVVNQREQRLLDDFSNRRAEQIADIVQSSNVSSADAPIELTDREIARLAQLRPYTEKDVKPKITNLSQADKEKLTSNLRIILKETLGTDRPTEIDDILVKFSRGLRNPINKLTTELLADKPITLKALVSDTAPLVTEWRNNKLNELMKDPYYRANPDKIKPKIEEDSKFMFGYGLKKKKQ